jgi:hypothetical protein
LVELQHSFQQLPGLLADGRDMGTVIFPGAPLKVFLTASAEKRAERRHKQLISKGFSTTISALRADLEARDARDTQRSVAPLKPAADAMHLDNSLLSIEESVAQVLAWWQSKQVFGPGRPWPAPEHPSRAAWRTGAQVVSPNRGSAANQVDQVFRGCHSAACRLADEIRKLNV